MNATVPRIRFMMVRSLLVASTIISGTLSANRLPHDPCNRSDSHCIGSEVGDRRSSLHRACTMPSASAVAPEAEAPPRSSASGDICARLTSSTTTVSLSPAGWGHRQVMSTPTDAMHDCWQLCRHPVIGRREQSGVLRWCFVSRYLRKNQHASCRVQRSARHRLHCTSHRLSL